MPFITEAARKLKKKTTTNKQKTKQKQNKTNKQTKQNKNCQPEFPITNLMLYMLATDLCLIAKTELCNYFFKILRGYFEPGGTQIWVGQGCAAWASKPLPILKGDFGRKGYPFLRISWKIGPFFRVVAMRKLENLGSVRRVDPCLRIFW